MVGGECWGLERCKVIIISNSPEYCGWVELWLGWSFDNYDMIPKSVVRLK